MKNSYSLSETDIVPACWTQILIIGTGPADACKLAEIRKTPANDEKYCPFGGPMRSIRYGRFIVAHGRTELYARMPEVDQLWHIMLEDNYPRITTAWTTFAGLMEVEATLIE